MVFRMSDEPAPESEGRTWRERAWRDAILAGDETAWRDVYDRFFEPLHAWIRFRAGGDIARTEEAVEEAWLVAVRRMRDFDPARGGMGAWLRGIAANVLRSQGRLLARRRRVERAPAEGGPDPADPAGNDGERRAELIEAIGAAMGGIAPRYRDVLREKYAEGRTVEEIAERRGETPKAVESLLSRARAAFREAYGALEEGA